MNLSLQDARPPHGFVGTLSSVPVSYPRAAPRRLAVLSMDVEDWYHLDYFNGISSARRHISMLDGLDVYGQLLADLRVRSTFFVVGDIANQVADPLRRLAAAGHDIGSHGLTHVRPLTQPLDVFTRNTRDARSRLQDLLGTPVPGFRASCFSLDRPRLEAVRTAGFDYDCSKIAGTGHPLYGNLNLHGFREVRKNIHVDGNFVAYEVSTLRLLGRHIPVSGGGYLRILPWPLMARMIRRYLRTAELYVLYIHPFELSNAASPVRGLRIPIAKSLRFHAGQGSVPEKLRALIRLLQQSGFSFTTFAELRSRILLDEHEGHS